MFNPNMTESSKQFLDRYMPSYKSAEKINDVLDELDNLMLVEGLDENDDPNEFWYEACAVYDDLFAKN